jgi:hypothetical protein
MWRWFGSWGGYLACQENWLRLIHLYSYIGYLWAEFIVYKWILDNNECTFPRAKKLWVLRYNNGSLDWHMVSLVTHLWAYLQDLKHSFYSFLYTYIIFIEIKLVTYIISIYLMNKMYHHIFTHWGYFTQMINKSQIFTQMIILTLREQSFCYFPLHSWFFFWNSWLFISSLHKYRV